MTRRGYVTAKTVWPFLAKVEQMLLTLSAKVLKYNKITAFSGKYLQKIHLNVLLAKLTSTSTEVLRYI